MNPQRGVLAGVGGAVGNAAEVFIPAKDLPLGQRIVHWIVSASSMGLVISIMIHVMITLVAALVTVGVAGIGSRGSGGGEFTMSLTSEGTLTGVMDAAPLDAMAPSVADTQVPELPTAGVGEGAGGMDAPGAGAGLGAGGSGTGGASFFGIEAKGSRFLYICDISGSMDWDESGTASGGRTRLTAMKRELTRSVQALMEHMQFYVFFFSSGVTPLNPDSTKWILAKDSGKKFALDRIDKLRAWGGTEPWPAFEQAFQMKPAPDAIYFMTDGEFDPTVALRIQAINVGSRKIPIHCITLVERTGEEVMRKIASDSGGTYTHVPGTR